MATTGKCLTFLPPAGGNYSGNVGLVVYMSGAGEATVSTDPATQKPLGIIQKAINATLGEISVCVEGYCTARAGAAITAGTHDLLMAGGDSRVDPVASARWSVGKFVGSATAADGEYVDVVVNPIWYEVN